MKRQSNAVRITTVVLTYASLACCAIVGLGWVITNALVFVLPYEDNRIQTVVGFVLGCVAGWNADTACNAMLRAWEGKR